jgi:hypothetical protein
MSLTRDVRGGLSEIHGRERGTDGTEPFRRAGARVIGAERASDVLHRHADGYHALDPCRSARLS